MTTYNRNFARLANGTPLWGPMPLTVVTHHHEEWDEPIYDPETGEPTGETEHKSRDWDTVETEPRPSAADYHQMNYLDVRDAPPSDPPPKGKEWVRTGKWVYDNPVHPTCVMPEYEARDLPPPPPRTFSKLKIVNALIASDVWQQVKAFLEQAGLYDQFLAAQDFAEDNEFFAQGKALLMAQLGWSEEQVESLLQASVAD